MKRITRGLTIFVLAAILILGGSGCMGLLKETKTDKTQAALEYMAQRYGREFVYAGPWGVGYTNTSVKHFLARPAGEEDGPEVLVRIATSDSRDSYQDNYLAVKYADEMRRLLQDAADQAFSQAKAFYTVSYVTLSPDLPADASFEEYSRDESAGILGTVAVSQTAFSADQVRLFGETVQQAGIRASLRVVVLNQQETESLELTQVNDAISAGEYAYFALVTIDPAAVDVQAEETP